MCEVRILLPSAVLNFDMISTLDLKFSSLRRKRPSFEKRNTNPLETVSTDHTFVPSDLDSLKYAIFVDAGFASNANYSSRLKFYTVPLDKHQQANKINYGCIKSKLVTRSVLTAELFVMLHGFDVFYIFRVTFNEIFGGILPLNVYTDSRSLFD